ncbi:hypothetical protein BJX76DRAFT_87532 [Aspergillus varians]
MESSPLLGLVSRSEADLKSTSDKAARIGNPWETKTRVTRKDRDEIKEATPSWMTAHTAELGYRLPETRSAFVLGRIIYLPFEGLGDSILFIFRALDQQSTPHYCRHNSRNNRLNNGLHLIGFALEADIEGVFRAGYETKLRSSADWSGSGFPRCVAGSQSHSTHADVRQ